MSFRNIAMTVLDLRQAVRSFSRKMIRKVAQPSGFIDGFWIKANPAYIDEEFKGDFQPVSGKDLNLLPEGERLKSLVKIYSIRPLYASGERVNTESDLILYNNDIYKVLTTYNRLRNSLTYKSILEYLPNGMPV